MIPVQIVSLIRSFDLIDLLNAWRVLTQHSYGFELLGNSLIRPTYHVQSILQKEIQSVMVRNVFALIKM